MFIELVDALRCPRPHAETWLVASAHRTEGRHIIDGTLGCPICRAEYPIRDAIASFGALSRRASLDTHAPSDEDLPLRLAALLDLSDDQGFALLAGSFAQYAPMLRELVPTHLVVLNADPAVPAGNGVSGLEMPDAIPFADGRCRAIALDETHASPPYLTAAARVLRPRGRLVAPLAGALPPGMTELARDDRLWVAEGRAPPPTLVRLRPRPAGS